MASQGEILIFNHVFARPSRFDIEFAWLLKYNLAPANSFEIQDFEGFLCFIDSSPPFALFRTPEKMIVPLSLFRWPRHMPNPLVALEHMFFPEIVLSHSILLPNSSHAPQD
jgi:hypothetical protein